MHIGQKYGPTVFFLCWLAITMLWWFFAFMQLPASSPAWLVQAKNVCFGTYENGLPDSYGWLKLLSPLSMLGILLAIWGKELRENLSSFRRWNWGRAILVLLVLLPLTQAVWVGKRVAIAMQATAASNANALNELPKDYPLTNRQAPDFSLIDQHKSVVTLSQLKGHTIYLTFAFAHCATICPTLVHSIKTTLKQQQDLKTKLLIVTLDPWRDRPSSLPTIAKDWQIPNEAHILSGSIDNVTRVHKLYNMLAIRDEKTGDITHPGLVFVIDQKGYITYTLNNPSPSVLVEAARRTVNKHRS